MVRLKNLTFDSINHNDMQFQQPRSIRQTTPFKLLHWTMAIAAICFFFEANLYAQSRGGTLRGTVIEIRTTTELITVIDSTGQPQARAVRQRLTVPLTGAKVQLKNTTYGALTDTAGFYVLRNIPRGIYDVVYAAEGYKTQVFRSISIKNDTITEIDMTLEPVASEANEITVTANRYEQRLQELSLSVSILRPEFFIERNSNTLDDALRHISGVNFINSTPSIRGSSGVSFGVGSRVQLLIDNIPFLSPDDGSARWDAFPVDFIARVEVIKGASSALYGSAGIGGAINIVTKNDFSTRTSLLTYAGLFDNPAFEIWKWSSRPRTQAGLELSHAQNFGRFSFYGSLTRRIDDGYRENFDFRRWRLFSKSAYQFSDAATLSLIATYTDEQRGSALFWRNIDNALLDGSQTSLRIASNNLIVAPTLNLKLSRTVDFIARARVYRAAFQDTDARNSNAAQYGIDVQTNALFAKGFTVTGGIETAYSNVEANIFGNNTAAAFALYLQGDLPILKSLVLNYGARYDAQTVNGESISGRLNPRGGLNWTIGEYTSLRANFGTAFRNPTISERFLTTQTGLVQVQPNPALKPESSLSYELGYLFSYSRPIELFPNFSLTNFTFDAAGFVNGYENLIEVRPTPGGAFSFQNVTNAQIAGYEISTTLTFNQRLLFISLSYTHTNPIDRKLNDWLKYRNRRLFYATIEANYKAFSVEWNYRFVSRFDAVDSELALIVPDGARLADANVSDVRAGVKFSLGSFDLAANLIVRNVFNYSYAEQPGSLAPIRQYILQLRTAL
jgi:outer membrane cobalamin receptor